MKKRVLQFIGSFHQGGSERQAVELVKLLKDEGSFDVFAATLNNDGVLKSEIDAVGLPEIPEFSLTSFYDVNFVRQLRRCVKYLRDNKIDLVQTHDFYTNIFGMVAAKLAGVPVRIASKRETNVMRSGSQNAAERIAFAQANAIIANAAAVKHHLGDSKKIHIIHNGIDTGRFDISNGGAVDVRRGYNLPDGEDVRFITTVANLRHSVKNIPMLLRTVARVIGKHANIHFVIAGEGELQPKLEAEARGLDVAGNVHFIGRCDDVPGLLSVSYACVLSSMAEGFSNSILEYMAAGKPVVATDVGGASEAVVNGRSGFLVASDDDAAMAERLDELLDDEDKACRFGEEGSRIAREKFSQTARLRAIVDLYNSFLNHNGSKRLRVLQLGPYPPPEGGITRNMLAIRDELLARDHEYSIIATSRSSRIDDERNVYHPGSVLALLRLLTSLNFDVLHLHIGGDISRRVLRLATVCALFGGKKTVLTLHSGGYPLTDKGQEASRHSIRGMIFRRFSRVIAVNEAIGDLFARYGIPAERIRVLSPHSLKAPDPQAKIPSNLSDFCRRHSPMLVSVGGMEEEYDPHFQVDAMKDVLAKFPDAGLMIVGNGSMQNEIQLSLDSSTYGDQVLLTGNIPHDVTLHLINDADIVLRTTLFDGDAISVREALFLGKPVIATDTSARPVGVHLIGVGDKAALVSEIENIVVRNETKKPQCLPDDGDIKKVVDLYEEFV